MGEGDRKTMNLYKAQRILLVLGVVMSLGAAATTLGGWLYYVSLVVAAGLVGVSVFLAMNDDRP
jgi:hypothetical protein